MIESWIDLAFIAVLSIITLEFLFNQPEIIELICSAYRSVMGEDAEELEDYTTDDEEESGESEWDSEYSSEDSWVEPSFPWDKLPAEIRLMVIEKMGLDTKLQFLQIASLEDSKLIENSYKVYNKLYIEINTKDTDSTEPYFAVSCTGFNGDEDRRLDIMYGEDFVERTVRIIKHFSEYSDFKAKTIWVAEREGYKESPQNVLCRLLDENLTYRVTIITEEKNLFELVRDVQFEVFNSDFSVPNEFFDLPQVKKASNLAFRVPVPISKRQFLDIEASSFSLVLTKLEEAEMLVEFLLKFQYRERFFYTFQSSAPSDVIEHFGNELKKVSLRSGTITEGEAVGNVFVATAGIGEAIQRMFDVSGFDQRLRVFLSESHIVFQAY